jgi:hypothetical protein
MKTLLVVIGAIVLVTLSCILNAWALSVLWGWFVVPLGVNALGIAHAFGVSLVASLLVRPHRDKTTNKEEYAAEIVKVILVPLMALLFGYIAVGFM